MEPPLRDTAAPPEGVSGLLGSGPALARSAASKVATGFADHSLT